MASFTPTPTTDKTTFTVVTQEIFLILSIMATILSALTIALIWIDVAEKAKKLAKRDAGTLIPRTRRFLQIFELIIAIGMVISCILFLQYIAFALGFLAAACGIVLYCLGLYRIHKELSVLNQDSKSRAYRDVISEIGTTAIGASCLLIGIIVMCLFILVDSSLYYWKNVSIPNAIPSGVLSFQIIVCFLSALDLVVLVSLLRQTRRYIAHFGETSKGGGDTNMSFNQVNGVTKRTSNLKVSNDRETSSFNPPTVTIAAYQQAE